MTEPRIRLAELVTAFFTRHLAAELNATPTPSPVTGILSDFFFGIWSSPPTGKYPSSRVRTSL